jgi:hypothetical protein
MDESNTSRQSDTSWIQYIDVLVETGMIDDWIENRKKNQSFTACEGTAKKAQMYGKEYTSGVNK